jgi:hypothetical protein
MASHTMKGRTPTLPCPRGCGQGLHAETHQKVPLTSLPCLPLPASGLTWHPVKGEGSFKSCVSSSSGIAIYHVDASCYGPSVYNECPGFTVSVSHLEVEPRGRAFVHKGEFRLLQEACPDALGLQQAPSTSAQCSFPPTCTHSRERPILPFFSLFFCGTRV